MLNDHIVYPYWNIPENSTVKLRLIIDGNHIEKSVIRLKFPGVTGDKTDRPVTVHVPCMEMYGEQDDVMNILRELWKTPSAREVCRQYWKKDYYIFQGFVLSDPLHENASTTNIRKFVLNRRLFKELVNKCGHSCFSSKNRNNVSFLSKICGMFTTTNDSYHLYDVNISRKNNVYGYPDFEYKVNQPMMPSNARKINQLISNELYDLSAMLPPKPTSSEQQVIFKMFEASVNGEKYDYTRWGQYFQPML